MNYHTTIYAVRYVIDSNVFIYASTDNAADKYKCLTPLVNRIILVHDGENMGIFDNPKQIIIEPELWGDCLYINLAHASEFQFFTDHEEGNYNFLRHYGWVHEATAKGYIWKNDNYGVSGLVTELAVNMEINKQRGEIV